MKAGQALFLRGRPSVSCLSPLQLLLRAPSDSQMTKVLANLKAFPRVCRYFFAPGDAMLEGQ